MKHILDDGRCLMASYDDIQDFFSRNPIIGKTISDIRPYCLDYMLKNIAEVEDFENKRTESAIDTDERICLIFEDGSNLEIEFSGDGPIILGFDTAKLTDYPEYDGTCYTLRTLFQYCIGREILGIHFEKSENRMMFPAYMGIDMSGDDEGIREIRFALRGGTTLIASGYLDYFRVEHVTDFGGSVTVKYSELINELNEET